MAGDCSGPFNIQRRFFNVAGDNTRIARSGNQDNLWITCRQSCGTAKRADVVHLDVGLAHDGDLLAGSIISAGVQAAEIVDRCEVDGSQIVVSRDAGRKLRRDDPINAFYVWPGIKTEIIQRTKT